MHPLLKIIISIFLVALVAYIFTSIAAFLDISTERYINYLLFISALVIFYMCLPSKRGEAFN